MLPEDEYKDIGRRGHGHCFPPCPRKDRASKVGHPCFLFHLKQRTRDIIGAKIRAIRSAPDETQLLSAVSPDQNQPSCDPGHSYETTSPLHL